MSNQEKSGRYPLLEALLQERGLRLKGTYTNADVATIFNVSPRTIQEWSRSGYLKRRNLPGRAKFLSQDLEDFLENSINLSGTRVTRGNLRSIGRK